MPAAHPPLRLCRDLGKAAITLAKKRGLGRRFKAYRYLLQGLIRTAYPPRVALVGAGEGVEILSALKGIKGAAGGPSGMDKCLYTIAHPADRDLVERAQRQYTIRGRVVNQLWPCHDDIDRLVARGDFWFSVVVVAPTTDAEWTLEALRTIGPLCNSGTLFILCRAADKPMRALAAALEERGWGGGQVQEIGMMWRYGGPKVRPVQLEHTPAEGDGT